MLPAKPGGSRPHGSILAFRQLVNADAKIGGDAGRGLVVVDILYLRRIERTLSQMRETTLRS